MWARRRRRHRLPRRNGGSLVALVGALVSFDSSELASSCCAADLFESQEESRTEGAIGFSSRALFTWPGGLRI